MAWPSIIASVCMAMHWDSAERLLQCHRTPALSAPLPRRDRHVSASNGINRKPVLPPGATIEVDEITARRLRRDNCCPGDEAQKAAFRRSSRDCYDESVALCCAYDPAEKVFGRRNSNPAGHTCGTEESPISSNAVI